MIRIVPLTGDGEPLLSPDTLWDGTSGDWALAGDDKVNAGGLRAKAALATAVLLCLMTDARVEPDELPPEEQNRGWPGDSFDLRTDLGETAIGSKLWLLRRSTASDATALRAEDYARAALQTLVDQGAVSFVEVTGSALPAERRIDLKILLKDRDGAVVFDRRFGVLWEQLRGLDRPLAV
ncbi:phage GP46 family protein [Mesorhizobium sp.]|uniref:phage GP46 family protein n=1 Tax=Mesorhizobium sp. TaxID=1871066 RepID=UPI00257C9503|nr:phage GP46 family protein [Mesorhizobium sp.]